MSGQISTREKCPQCGYVPSPERSFPDGYFFRPWDLRHGRKAVKAYVQSLGEEANEWLLALYVDPHLQLIAVETVNRGQVDEVHVPFWKLMERGKALAAAGFVLVHNHPSGDPRPSLADIRLTVRLAQTSRDLDMPLLDHLIVAGEHIGEVAEWHWRDEPYRRCR